MVRTLSNVLSALLGPNSHYAGYPDFIMDDSKLAAYYSGISEVEHTGSSFFANAQLITADELNRNRQKLHEPVDKSQVAHTNLYAAN